MKSAFLRLLTATALIMSAAPVSAAGQFGATPGKDQAATITHPTAAELRMMSLLRNSIYPYSARSSVEGVLNQNNFHYAPDSKRPNYLVVTVEHSPQNYFVVGTLRATFKFDQNNMLITYDVEEELPGEGAAVASKEQAKTPAAQASESGSGKAAASSASAENGAAASAEEGSGEAAASTPSTENTVAASTEGGSGEAAPTSPPGNAVAASAEGDSAESAASASPAANTVAAAASSPPAGSDNTSLGAAPPAAAAYTPPAAPAKPAYASASAAPVTPEAPPPPAQPAYTGGFLQPGVTVLQGGFQQPKLPASYSGTTITLPPSIAAMVGAGQPAPSSGGAASPSAFASPFFAPQQAASSVPPPPGGMEFPAMPGDR